MPVTVKGYYQDGNVVLSEPAPVTESTEVIVTFPEKQNDQPRKILLGQLTGKITVPDDFDEPLDELKDYM